MVKQTWLRVVVTSLIALAAGCTVHPAGEREERQAALSAGQIYRQPVQRRTIPPLPERPTSDDLVRYALLANADVERAYWEWRAALEQVPIDGTQATNLAVTGSLGISHGNTSLGQATVAAGSDPMADIVLPNKLDAAARRALELARAAGKRFRQSQLDLRMKVLSAYDDYALTAEISRLDQQDVALLATITAVTLARNRSGGAGQQNVLAAENDLDDARNDLASNDAQLPGERASLNALLNRPSDSPLLPPKQLPPARGDAPSDHDLFEAMARENPQLAQLSDEVNGRRVGIRLASLQYEPDISLMASTDLQGVAETVTGMVTVPILKYEAIHASVAQAEANLRAAELSRDQTRNDLATEAVGDVENILDLDSQIKLFTNAILPRAREIVALTRSGYETGNGSLLDVLNGQRSLIEIERLLANATISRDKRLADLEALTSTPMRAVGNTKPTASTGTASHGHRDE